MLEVGFASVGAGYTTVLRSGGGAALIDFGGSSGAVALRGLERISEPFYRGDYLRWPWWTAEPFSQLVISHPHADHYSGLLHLANVRRDRWRDRDLLREGATFFHPVVPKEPEAQALVHYLMHLNNVISGLPEYALGRAVAATSAGRVRREPLWRGRHIELGGAPVDVLWPPLELDDRCRTRLRRLVQEYESVAEDAAAHGDDRLIRAVAAVRESSDDLRAEERLYGVSEEGQWQEFADDFSAQDDDESSRRHIFADPALEARARRLRSAISQGANYLSLVLATSPQRYVFLGDLDQSLHDEVTRDLLDEDHEVILSAHHGTHFGAGLRGLRSRFVVSSVGGRLARSVRDEYKAIGTHIRTDAVGDVVVSMTTDGTHLTTCSCDGI